MAVSFQVVIDRADPEPFAHIWAAAPGYKLEPPPNGFVSWNACPGETSECLKDGLGTGMNYRRSLVKFVISRRCDCLATPPRSQVCTGSGR